MNNKIVSKVTAIVLLFSIIGYTLPIFAYTKDETVYTKLDASGNDYKTIISTHIVNDEEQDFINDLSDLLNIKNTSGDEEFEQNGNTLTWKANKNDIYYQGESEKELPIECKVRYELDGKEISAKEIVGKSGKVKITLEYTNKEEKFVNINGKKVKMYVPFVVLAGTIVKNEKASNIEISSGKIVDDGTKTIIAGIAMPGLQESLGLSKKEVEIPNNIEIIMDAKDFELGSVISYVTPKVIDKEDINAFNKLDEIYNKVGVLQSSSKQIENGANELNKGTTQLVSGANELRNGISVAYAGTQTIKLEVAKSTKSLQNDKSEALDEATLNSIKEQAAAGAKLTEVQKEQISEQAKSSAILTETQKQQITEQASKSAILTEEQREQIKAQATASSILTETQREQIKAQATANSVLTDIQKNQIIEEAQNNYPIELTGGEKLLLISVAQNTATQTAVTTALTTAQNTATTTAVTTALETAQNIATQTAIATALSTAQSIATQTAMATALSTAQNTATTTAIQTSTTVAKQVGNQAKKTFTNQVVSQMSTLGNGLNQLTNGLEQLNSGADSLVDGTEKINNGAENLSNGIKTFNEEGIEKICNYINNNAKGLTDRIEKLTELSKEYNNFTMLDGENKGNVKFIMIMDAIKKQEANDEIKEEIITHDDKVSEEDK